MKKNTWIWVVIVVVLIAVVGGYLIFHKSKPATTPTASTSTTSNSTSTTSAGIVQTKTASGVGQYLANSNGAALYTYSGDTTGVSNCNGACLAAWPAYSPSASSSSTLPANVTIITRSDGTKQYAYKGLPLYTFTSDSNGQVTGNGVSGFVVAKP